jgi:hypothetical protein
MADDDRPSPAELLSKLVEGLPEEDRQRVLVWLLDRSLGTGPEFGGVHATRRDWIEAMPTLLAPGEESTSRTLTAARRGEYQVVPIRLPTEQHAALRDWCAEHGFSMATVVRGLVERFLDERAGR